MTMWTMLAWVSERLPRGLLEASAIVSLVSPASNKGVESGESDKSKSAEAPPSSSAKIIQMHAADREFLPAALELIEAPPSPIVVSFIWTICLLFAAALAWAWFGRLDIYAVASGKIEPNGESKVVQSLDLGKVVGVFVRNGSAVKAGDLLLELDSTETGADSDALARDVESDDAEVARRRAAIGSVGSNTVASIQFDPTTDQATRQREQAVLESDLAKLTAGEDTLKAQLAQAAGTVQKLTNSIGQREEMIALDKELVDMREALTGKGTTSRAQVIEALQRYETDLITQVTERGQLREAKDSAEATERKIAELDAQFLADQMDKLEDTQRKRDHTFGDFIKARSKNAQSRLTTPVDGVVQQLAVTSIGQVVTSGQVLMTVVPKDAQLEVAAMVLNADIGFIKTGQEAVVKVDAFPFSRYGTLDGTVSRVSADAVDTRSAPNLSEAAATVKPQSSPTSSKTDQPELAFPVTVALARTMIKADGKEIDLFPGMTVSVEIKTGSRRVIDYLLSPLREVASDTAHER
jgi:hemolysin D